MSERCFAMNTTCALCLSFVLAASAVAAQQPSPGPQSFRTNIDAVEIDVRVLDEQGRPVTGLTAADFDVFEDGVRQNVSVFSTVQVPVASRPRAAAYVEPDTRSNREPFNGRLYVFVLDDLHTHPLRTPRVKAVVRQFLDRHFAANDWAAIVTTSGRRETVQELTSSPAALLRALDAFTGQQIRSSTLERIAEYYRRRNSEPPSDDEEKKRDPMRIGDPLEFERVFQARRALISLRDVARWLDSVPARRKALVFVSEGIDYDIHNLNDNLSASGLLSDVRDAVANAARSNTSIYAIDPRGLAGLQDDAIEVSSLPDETTGLGASAFAEALRWTQDNLRILAEETGGFALLNTNDVHAGFDRLVRENSEYYVLGYQSTNVRRDGRFRRVEVRVKRPNVRAVARRGYFAPEDRPARKEEPNGIRALIDSVLPVPGLPIDSTVTVFRGPKDKASALVTVEIGPEFTLTDEGDVNRGKVEVTVVAVGTDARIAASDSPVVTLNLRDATRDAVQANGIRASSRLELKPGRYQIRIAAKDAMSGKAGTVLHDVVVPDFTRAPVAMSQVLLASRGAARVVTTMLDPVLKGALDAPPTAIRQFERADVMTVLAEVYDNRRKDVDPVTLTTTITDERGTAAYRSEERLEGPAFEPERHSYRHRLAIPLHDFAPGAYVLRVTAQTPGVNQAVTREVGFAVRREAASTD
jgi:VWFA-related protein